MEGMLSCGEGCSHMCVRVCVSLCVYMCIYVYVLLLELGHPQAMDQFLQMSSLLFCITWSLQSKLYPDCTQSLTHVCVNIVFSDTPDKRYAENGVSA